MFRKTNKQTPKTINFNFLLIFRLSASKEVKATSTIVSSMLSVEGMIEHRGDLQRPGELFFSFLPVQVFHSSFLLCIKHWRKSLSGHWLTAEIMEKRLQYPSTPRNIVFVKILWKSHWTNCSPQQARNPGCNCRTIIFGMSKYQHSAMPKGERLRGPHPTENRVFFGGGGKFSKSVFNKKL